MSLGIFARWAMLGHHISHGGYNWYNKNNKYKKNIYALKNRRVIDWLDWILPEAWNIEHNKYHHYYLGEEKDPDLVENNLYFLRNSKLPIIFKYIVILFFALTWKWSYYAPNTYKEYCFSKIEEKDNKLYNEKKYLRKYPAPLITFCIYYNIKNWVSTLFSYVLMPYFIYTFICIPSIWLFISYVFNDYNLFNNTIINIILGEILTNIHSFIVIVPNHAGNDIYKFTKSVQPNSGEFYVHQIIGSVNYSLGNNYIDYLHGWLNYQIEHHLFPNLSMLSIQKSAPLIKNICIKHNIPYVQHNVFYRLYKLIKIMTGEESMKIWKE